MPRTIQPQRWLFTLLCQLLKKRNNDVFSSNNSRNALNLKLKYWLGMKNCQITLTTFDLPGPNIKHTRKQLFNRKLIQINTNNTLVRFHLFNIIYNRYMPLEITVVVFKKCLMLQKCLTFFFRSKFRKKIHDSSYSKQIIWRFLNFIKNKTQLSYSKLFEKIIFAADNIKETSSNYS